MNKSVIQSVFCAVLTIGACPTLAGEIDFNQDVRPILSDRCFKCHGPDAANQDSEFRVDTFENATADLGGYAAIVPGDLDASTLHQRIHDADDPMPPSGSLKGLTDREKEILDQWILAGAPFDKHWAFKPLPTRVDVPEISDPWVRNEVDRFILARLIAGGMAPNREAPKEKWLRRVTFDLTGLPPTLAELDAFLTDTSEGAYQRVVDRLLASEACAERLATEWLDVARYSDSFGYQRDDDRFVWPYRDWVIDAFRRNMPYNQFVTWQLAGDLLPDATREQILATTFNRLHSHNKEGGVSIEEFRVEYVSDRTHTFGTAFLGMTMECCRCHDHKYDPLTMQDYYSLSAFFDKIDERGLISFFTDATPTPALSLPSDEQQQQHDQALAELATKESAWDRHLQSELDEQFNTWLVERQPAEIGSGMIASLSFESLEELPPDEAKNETGGKVDPASMRGIANGVGSRAVTPTSNRLVAGRIGQAIELTGDDAVMIPGLGHYERHQPWSFALWIWNPEVSERSVIVRHSRGWDDAGTIGYELTREGDRLSAKLAHFWPGDAIGVETTVPLQPDRWYHVAVTYDGSSRADGLKMFLDGELAEATIVQDRLTRTISQWRDGYYDLAIGSRYRDRGFKQGRVDEFRMFDRSLAPIEVRQLYDGESLAQTLARPIADLSPQDRSELREYYLQAVDPVASRLRAELSAARQQANAVVDRMPSIMVMREAMHPRQTYVLKRGRYDQPTDPVTAATPAFLPPFPEHAPQNRLGLAQWLFADDHPLTARVTVNRYWQMLFGRGLVQTSEDFGNQGAPPTHPALLDWLARDFVDSGWDVHRLISTMCLSSTYRQSSVVSPTVRQLDPENRLLGRGTNQRLSAEMIRDNALAVSGLLVKRVGGPPVRPYDVALAYTPLPVDQGDGLYRRSLYTYWKRTSPAPVMMTLNSGTREVCRLRREITSSPLQSLVLLNSPQFVEAAKMHATDLLRQYGDDVDQLVEHGFRQYTSRRPTSAEAQVLRTLYEEQLAEFTERPENAAKFLEAGAAELQDRLVSVSREQLAAVTVLVNTMMNLDECVRHQ